MTSRASIAARIRDKRVGVCLASGFFGFYHQAGVLRALEEQGIEPLTLTGTSAGALTGSIYAAGLDPRATGDALISLKRQSYWDMHWPFTRLGFGMLAGHRFRSELARVLPVHSFEECRTPLTVGVYDLEDGRVKHISSGPLIPAVYASCSYPYLFTPAELNGRRYWDGGFGEKCALVPFLKEPEVDVVIVSYMPRGGQPREGRAGIRAFLPPLSSLMADTPYEERYERDVTSVRLLREAGKEVLVFCPDRVRLGPFTMHKGAEAFERGREGTLAILDSSDDKLLGAPQLS